MTDIQILMLTNFVTAFGLILAWASRSVYRDQVKLLQRQRRTDAEFKRKGNTFVPVVEGLWADLDENERLKAENALLRGEA